MNVAMSVRVHICGFYLNRQKIFLDLTHDFVLTQAGPPHPLILPCESGVMGCKLES